MRTLLGISAVLLLACGVTAADEKIDAKKLVGKWDQVFGKDAKGAYKVVIEYTADGKVLGTITPAKGEEIKIEGTYKLDGNKLTQTTKFMDKESVKTSTITKLTDDELEGETDKGLKATFKRIKAEKK